MQNRYKVGDEVKVEFRGVIYRVELQSDGMVTYDVKGDTYRRALDVPESSITPEEQDGRDTQSK